MLFPSEENEYLACDRNMHKDTVDLIAKAQALNPLAKRTENCLWDLWCMGQTTERRVLFEKINFKLRCSKFPWLRWSVSGSRAVLGQQLSRSVLKFRFNPLHPRALFQQEA